MILQIKIRANGDKILNNIRMAVFTSRVNTRFTQLCTKIKQNIKHNNRHKIKQHKL